MKKNMKFLIALISVVIILISGCDKQTDEDFSTTLINTGKVENYTGKIYIYGEEHGVKKFYDEEFNIWKKFYNENNMRHLFIETPYFTAEYLNLWMKSDDDEIIMQIYDDMEGTAGHNLDFINFFKQIKKEMPETIFHGTDIGHAYNTMGARYLSYLESQNLKDSETYKLTQEAIEQGRVHYEKSDDVYRENMMVKNFVRELSTVKNSDIMGVYGSAHTGLDVMRFDNKVSCMAKQLGSIYENQVYSENLSILLKSMEPIRIDNLEIMGNTYDASYFGKQDLNNVKEYEYREFWRLEGAFDDFKILKKSGDKLPYYNYPMNIEEGQVFVLEYKKIDGTVEKMYYIADGSKCKDFPSTVGVIIK